MDSAVITVDMHRGHLDPAVATLGLPEHRIQALLASVVPFIAQVRQLRVPIVHVITEYRDATESVCNPFWQRHHEDPTSTRRQMTRHNLSGSPGTELVPGLAASSDWLVYGKKRYDAFWGTGLGVLLHTHQVRQLYFLGVNTNSCVLATAISANVQDFDVAVIKEGVSTMDSWGLHEASLDIIETAFGRILTMAQVLDECRP